MSVKNIIPLLPNRNGYVNVANIISYLQVGDERVYLTAFNSDGINWPFDTRVEYSRLLELYSPLNKLIKKEDYYSVKKFLSNESDAYSILRLSKHNLPFFKRIVSELDEPDLFLSWILGSEQADMFPIFIEANKSYGINIKKYIRKAYTYNNYDGSAKFLDYLLSNKYLTLKTFDGRSQAGFYTDMDKLSSSYDYFDLRMKHNIHVRFPKLRKIGLIKKMVEVWEALSQKERDTYIKEYYIEKELYRANELRYKSECYKSRKSNILGQYISNNRPDLVKVLLEYGADPREDCDYSVILSLRQNFRYNINREINLDGIKLLLQYGASTTISGGYDIMNIAIILYLAKYEDDATKLAHLFVQYGYDLNRLNKYPDLQQRILSICIANEIDI